ncbi:hypothetical protein CDAR_376131 [Caerostris darwini]|uniref:Uncharacterized protein n=1 Tax=Caerostris darwini TaxID=1538125 RepID=A0AAV4VF00_9ARAC|nr:hypothetical protein CDAR_376131 [Caerostris darwini]
MSILDKHNNLNEHHGGSITTEEYPDAMIDRYFKSFASAIGNESVLLGDNAELYRARKKGISSREKCKIFPTWAKNVILDHMIVE